MNVAYETSGSDGYRYIHRFSELERTWPTRSDPWAMLGTPGPPRGSPPVDPTVGSSPWESPATAG